MYRNMFQNAEILQEEKISQAAYIGFHPILSQDPKDFKIGTSVEGELLIQSHCIVFY